MTVAVSNVWRLETLVAQGRMATDWAEALVAVRPDVDVLLEQIQGRVRAHGEASDTEPLPASEHVFRAFEAPLASVRVLVVGQDPYPTPGHAVGLSFAVDADVRPLPRSLVNIYTELEADLGVTPAPHGDLSAWSTQGVLLLNRVLTVGAGDAGSHRRMGWEQFTDAAVAALVARHEAAEEAPLVAVLWGRDAQALAPALGAVPSVVSAHPSPLSARRGFFGSRPFSRVNALLESAGAAPINWNIVED